MLRVLFLFLGTREQNKYVKKSFCQVQLKPGAFSTTLLMKHNLLKLL